MMNADIEALVLSGELFNSSNPERTSPDSGWHDDLLELGSEESHPSGVEEKSLAMESIGMGPGRTGVKGVIRDRDEANAVEREKHSLINFEKADSWKRGDLGGKTYLEEEREKARENELFGLEQKVDQLVLKDIESSNQHLKQDAFGRPRNGKFGHLREVGVKGFLSAVEKEDSGIWVVVHLYDPSLDRCYDLDDTLARLARLYPDTKFLRARASALGFTSTHSGRRLDIASRMPVRLHKPLAEMEEKDPYDYPDTDECREETDDQHGEDIESDFDDADVDLDMLPTVLVYRSGELVHNWVRVDWEAGEASIEELLDKHNILSHSGSAFGNLSLPLDSDDDDDGDLLWNH